MFISKLTNYLEQIDPYYTQRINLRKRLYLAVLLTIVYFLAKPDSFIAYILPPALLASIYDAPTLTSYKEKDWAIVFAFLISGIGGIIFYLLFPFKFTLMIVIAIYLGSIYFFCNKYYPKFIPFIPLTVIINAINMPMLPTANFQVAIDMFFCTMLGFLVVIIALKLHPNLYGQVWYRAFGYYTKSVIEDLSYAIDNLEINNHYTVIVKHLNIIRAYRRLLPHKIIFAATKATVNIRNIQFALSYVRVKSQDKQFWYDFYAKFSLFHLAVVNKRPCQFFEFNQEGASYTHNYVYLCLNRSILSWNKLCKLV